jgi:2',3'-cyclic-nucleotide 2'-phosphodiesterase (5'-nucleotidase family)
MAISYFQALLVSALLVFCYALKISAQENNLEVNIIFASEIPDISNDNVGGYAQLASLVETARSRNPNTFFLFGGGSIGPSALSNFDHGAHIVDILNSLEPDAMGVAKREFTYFEDELSLRSYEAVFPFVSSNLIDTRINNLPDGLFKNALITKQDVSLGFISIISEQLTEQYLLDKIQVLHPLEAIKSQAEYLRSIGADLIVLHYFFPFEFVPQLISEDIIDLAFISNTRLPRSRIAANAKIPQLITPSANGQAQIVNVNVSSNNNKSHSNDVRTVDLISLPKSKSTDSLITQYRTRINRLLNDEVGLWDGYFTTEHEFLFTRENAFGNYIADTIRRFSSADIAIINSGSIRGDTQYIDKTPITRRTIATELPFRSVLKILEVSGKDVIDALENGFSNIENQRPKYPQISGLRVSYNSKAPPGERVVSVMVQGKPLIEEAIYLVATSDYIANGGDGYASLAHKNAVGDRKTQNNILISDLLLRDIISNGYIDSKIDGRMTDINKERLP